MQSGHGAWAGGRPSHERGHGEGTRPSPREGAQRGDTEREHGEGHQAIPTRGDREGCQVIPTRRDTEGARLGGGARNGRCSGQAREPGRRSGAIEVQDDMRGRGHNNRTDGAPEAKNTDP